MFEKPKKLLYLYYEDIFSKMGEKGIKYLLIGGVAVNLHGIQMATGDIDLLLAMDKENCKFLKDILKTLSDESDFYLKKVVEYEITDTDCWFKKAKLAMFQRRDSNNKLQ